MNTFWLKVAAAAVLVVVVIILINVFSPSESKPEPEPKPKSKTFYDVAAQDREKFLKEPKPAEPTEEKPPVPEPQPPQQTPTARQAPKPPETVTMYFTELSEIEQIEAERLLNVAVPGRSMGRLPTTGYNLMVESCRQILRRWPDSWYAYRAKQMLADMPERFRTRYRITEEELDLSRFARPRPGTKPFEVENN
jgi:type IV secretory pathway VirB10-like protein